jgi:hypothetical protein
MTLPSDRDARNALQVWDGCIAYFPDAWAEIAKVSAAGNKQYNFGGTLRWERSISIDHFNKVMRHMLDHQAGNVIDADGCFHLAKAAWRVLAALQLAIEANQTKDVEAQHHGIPEVADRGPQLYDRFDFDKEQARVLMGRANAQKTGPELILNNKAEEPISIRKQGELISSTPPTEAYQAKQPKIY